MGPLVLRNRVVFGAHFTMMSEPSGRFGEPGFYGRRQGRYLADRAEGPFNRALVHERRGELQKAKARLLKRRGGKPGKIYWRRCERCQENWPATHRFFARSPKRRDGKVVAVYLRRSCRVCPRRGRS